MPKKILIIEDESDICNILAFRFKKNGFEVFCAKGGKEGLDKARVYRPDLILLDLMLPELPGEQVCKEIRKDVNIEKIPIIMLTAKDSDVDRVVGRVIGANYYMTKPFDINELLDKVGKLIGTSGA